MTCVVVVDDHPLFRDGFAHMVRALRPQWSLHLASNASEARGLLNLVMPDLVIIDIGLPDDDGFVLLAEIACTAPALPQVLLSGRDDSVVQARAKRSGARAFISKATDPNDLVAQLDQVLAGTLAFASEAIESDLPELTTRQAEILGLLADGHGNKEIRHRLGIAERTVRAHLTDIFQMLRVQSRTQALIRARDMGMIP